MKKYLALISLLVYPVFLFSQTILLPVVNIKSHKTLSVDKIEITPGQTRVSLSVENQKTDGDAWFCADKNIYILDNAAEKKYFLVKSEGIPTCPDAYKFKKAGEILKFSLYFPEIPSLTKEIDIIEDCADNCFYFKGVLLDPDENAEIKLFEKGIALFADKKFAEALKSFQELSVKTREKESNLFGYTLYIIPLIYYKMDDPENARAQYATLVNSSITDRAYFLEKLKEEEFFRNLK